MDLVSQLLGRASQTRQISDEQERTMRMCEFWTGATVGRYAGGYDVDGIAREPLLWREACDYADRVTEQRFPGWLNEAV